jgi:hypothetical protein
VPNSAINVERAGDAHFSRSRAVVSSEDVARDRR